MSIDSRRDFIKAASVIAGGVALFGLAGCSTKEQDPAPMDHSGSTTATDGRMDYKEMDRMHEEGMKAFPAKTEKHGNQLLPFKMDGDVKVFELVAQEIEWETEPGKKKKAMAYNGMVPGPVFRVTEGDKVRILFKNEMKESTAVHWHGLRIPNKMDGVTYLNQPPVTPGGTFVYEFVAKNPGSHMYHAHHNSAEQVGRGLAGAFIIEPKDKSKEPASDLEYLVFLNDSQLGYTINGKGFPATEAYTAKLNQRVRFRFYNAGSMIHPMHLHGFFMEVFAKDGNLLPNPYHCDTLCVAPGERYDVMVLADEPGPWAFHCHILSHAESEHGMYGMTTAFIVE